MKQPLLKSASVLGALLLVTSACAQPANPANKVTTNATNQSTNQSINESAKTTQSDGTLSAAIDSHLRQVLTQVGVEPDDIISIKPSDFPNMYQVSFEGQPPLHITADGKYFIFGALQKTPNQNKGLVRSTPTHIDSSQVGTPLDIDTAPPFYYTAVPGVLWSTDLKGVPFLVSDNAQYLTDSEISIIEDGEVIGLDENFEQRKNQSVLNGLDESEMIVYPATAAEKAIVYVVTDVNCPYCRKLHQQINRFNRKGVTLKMIGYPIYEQSPEQMRGIWCQTDASSRRKAFDKAMLAGKMTPAPASCTTNYLTSNREKSAGLAVMATPMIFREDGVLYQASFESPEFLEFLGIE